MILSASGLQEEALEGSMQVCLYCQDHCESDLFAQEPVWTCAWCRATTHVRCYRDFHAHSAEQCSSRPGLPQEGQKTFSEESESSGREAGSLKLPRLSLEGSEGPTHTRRHGRRVAALRTRHTRCSASFWHPRQPLPHLLQTSGMLTHLVPAGSLAGTRAWLQ